MARWPSRSGWGLPADRRQVLLEMEAQELVARILDNDPKTAANNLSDLAARLALDAAYPVAGVVSLGQAMGQAYSEKIAEVRQVDSQEGSPDSLIAGDWLESRL